MDKKFESGIYLLLFNTTEKWIRYHQYSSEEYLIGGQENEDPYENNLIQQIPKDLIPDKGDYQYLVQQEKDQISFYFVPTSMVLKGELIYTSK